MQWLLAGSVGLALALVEYGRARGGAWGAAACRGAAAALLAALALDAPAGRAASPRPFAALDVSASWRRARESGTSGADPTGFRTALAAVAASQPESVFLVGDSLRPAQPPALPADHRSRVRAAVDRAVAAGHPLVLVTDGEVDDPAALDALPGGSRVEVIARPSGRDAALAGLDAPRAAVAGDTIPVRVAVMAGSAGAGAGRITLLLDDTPVATAVVGALTPYAEVQSDLRVPIAGRNGPRLLRAVVASAGDVEARNDTATVALDVAPAIAAVFVSTSPDEDARYALSVLRGTLALPTRGFFRVSPGNWRQDGSLAAASDADVRRAVATAPVVVLQGDTAVLGPPRHASRGGLALLVGARPGAAAGRSGDGGEWYATDAPPSPIAGALRTVSWDSLPPIDVGDLAPAAPHAGADRWSGLEVRRARRFERRIAVSGSDADGRRVVVVSAAGLWRWRFRGGAGTSAFTALWGGIFDWLATDHADERAVVPAEGMLREGDSLRWRRGSGTDSIATVALARRGGGAEGERGAPVDSVRVRFPAGGTVAATAPLAAGVYDGRVRGGQVTVVVNTSTEWLPRRPSVATSRQSGAAVADLTPRLRSLGWAYAAVILALCGEWILRRRLGLR